MSEHSIDSNTIKAIKREAKSLKRKRPDLTYCQRLDIAAQKIAAVRNFHEASVRSEKNQDTKFEFLGDVGPGHHAPRICPKCGAIDSLELIEEDTEQMTDGQLADYEAGLYGVSVCHVCNYEVDWEI